MMMDDDDDDDDEVCMSADIRHAYKHQGRF
jgi:hypothetical protein